MVTCMYYCIIYWMACGKKPRIGESQHHLDEGNNIWSIHVYAVSLMATVLKFSTLQLAMFKTILVEKEHTQ